MASILCVIVIKFINEVKRYEKMIGSEKPFKLEEAEIHLKYTEQKESQRQKNDDILSQK